MANKPSSTEETLQQLSLERTRVCLACFSLSVTSIKVGEDSHLYMHIKTTWLPAACRSGQAKHTGVRLWRLAQVSEQFQHLQCFSRSLDTHIPFPPTPGLQVTLKHTGLMDKAQKSRKTSKHKSKRRKSKKRNVGDQSQMWPQLKGKHKKQGTPRGKSHSSWLAASLDCRVLQGWGVSTILSSEDTNVVYKRICVAMQRMPLSGKSVIGEP